MIPQQIRLEIATPTGIVFSAMAVSYTHLGLACPNFSGATGAEEKEASVPWGKKLNKVR